VIILIEDKSLKDMSQATQKGIRFAKTAKRFIKYLKFLLPYIAPLLLIFLILFLIIMVIFWAAPQGKLYTTTAHTEEDARLLGYYQQLAEENNTYRFLVDGESTWYPSTSNRDRNLTDRYGRDAELFETFGQIHAANMFYILSHHLKETDDDFKSTIASDLKPYLYYKESTVTTTYPSEEGEIKKESTVYLLVEAYTIQGHYLYQHEWVTETNDNMTITYERPAGSTQILPNRWQRLDDWVRLNYALNSEEDTEMLRTAVFEAAKGYTDFSESLSWLLSEEVDSFYISGGFIPVELSEYFSKASQVFGIPEWFLAAIAYQESSFNPTAENPSGAYGLFQLMPSTQKQEIDKLIKHYPYLLPQALLNRYTDDPGFYREAVSDPYINTLCGALHLIDKGLIPSEIDWESNKWKNQTLPCLAAYGGYVSVPESLWKKYNITTDKQAKEKAIQWARDDYASRIWKHAEQFNSKITWPTIQSPITAYFGELGPYWVNGHTGLDFGVASNTPVYAVSNAEVTFSGWKGAYGKCIMISNGWYTFLYGHLDSIDVKIGDKVTAGQVIGKSGDTGNSSGPHLHFEVRNVQGGCIDPLIWLSAQ
jgi:hypothetical protein